MPPFYLQYTQATCGIAKQFFTDVYLQYVIVKYECKGRDVQLIYKLGSPLIDLEKVL